MKSCEDGKILNPESERCVNINGRIGKSILKKMFPFPCPDGKILNPESERCVNINGRIGKSILKNRISKSPTKKPRKSSTKKPRKSPTKKPRKSPTKKPSKINVKPVGVGIPTSFLPIVEDCNQNQIWKKYKLIGSGKMGNIYITCKGINCDYVIKMQEENDVYYTEIEALLSLQHTKAVPIVFAAWTCEKIGYIVMEKLYKCSANDSILWKEIGKKLDIIRKEGYLHIDIHNGNVMCNKDGDVILIDFGYAVKRTINGDTQRYPDNMISHNYNWSLTWEYLQTVQENNHNKYFNPAASYTKGIPTKEQINAHQKCTKKYMDARKKLCLEGCQIAC
jgi:hypothetical protein